MIDFNSLIIAKGPQQPEKVRMRQYIIGTDLFLQNDEKEEGVNVFTVFSTIDLRNIMICRTKKNFDWFVNFVKQGDVLKQEYLESRKFIDDAGNVKKHTEIRSN
jgi:hypothetical protein